MAEKLKLKKSLGQNFLKNQDIINKIVESAEILPDSLVIEIGPGGGALTKKLVKKSSFILAYEIDKSLAPNLNRLKEENSNLTIIYDDFLKRNLKKDIENFNVKNIYVIANLPYYITTPIIEKIIESNINIKKMVIMVQKEVGDRFIAVPGNKGYNSLTVFLNYYFNIKKLFIVSRGNFIPQPKVDSMVVMFETKEKLEVNDSNLFFKVVRDSFRFKRKTIKNNLKEYDLEKIEKVLISHNLNLNVRAEQVSLRIFCDIANILSI